MNYNIKRHQVFDGRNIPYHRIENELYDIGLDVYEIAVYCLLCRYADNKNDNCFPSYETLAKKLNMSRKKAIQTIKSLENKNLISKETRKCDETAEYSSNLYTILSVKNYRKDIGSECDTPPSTKGSECNTPGGGLQPPKQYSLNNTQFNNLTTTTDSPHDYPSEEKITTGKPDVVVDAMEVKHKIESTIQAEITLSKTKELIDKKGIEKIMYYLSNWHKFKMQKIDNITGFFISAVIYDYPVPKSENLALKMRYNELPLNMTNFDQRQYTEEEYEEFYTKFESEDENENNGNG